MSSIDFKVTLLPISTRRSSKISAKLWAFPVSEPYKIVMARDSGVTSGSLSASIVSVCWSCCAI